MADPPPSLVLTPTRGRQRTLGEWLTVFPLFLVAVDPVNERSAWIVETAGRILSDYEQADVRVAWLVAGNAEEAALFLGNWAQGILTFTDPDLTAVRAFGLETLPAAVHIGMDGGVVNAVEGWDPMTWRAMTTELSRQVGWSRPAIPRPRDPAPFAGAPVEPPPPAGPDERAEQASEAASSAGAAGGGSGGE